MENNNSPLPDTIPIRLTSNVLTRHERLVDTSQSPRVSVYSRSRRSRLSSVNTIRRTTGHRRRSASYSYVSGSLFSRPSMIPEYNEEDANLMILRANEPPKYKGGFDAVMKEMKARKFYTKQFQGIQQQTEMGKTLYFSDVEPTFYESNYLNVAQETSVRRVRLCYTLGIVALATLYLQELISGAWDPDAGLGRTEKDKFIITCMTFGGILIPTFLALMSTCTSFGRRNLENITFSVFALVAFIMIIKKPIEKYKGPIIPLLILLIPISGITRMRFFKSCILGWSIFLFYFVTMGISRNISGIIPNPDKFDDYTNISYQSINYAISVIGGMVSQYRQELLRRRNFCLQLPFSGTMDEDSVAELTTDKFSKKALMHPWSQKFRHPQVEECFYKYWYLIDPFPYNNPNSGTLHTDVFRTIRFAVLTLLLNQFVLLLQDVKILLVQKDMNVRPYDFVYALIMRYGITVPLYLSAGAFMYFVGKAFFERWIREAEEARSKGLGISLDVNIDMSESDSSGVRNQATEDSSRNFSNYYRMQSEVEEKTESERRLRQLPSFRTVVNAARLRRQLSKDQVMDVILRQNGGYVRSAQVFSSLVIACHVFCMGFLLLLLSRDRHPKPLYYMGFLNAVLFAHRSGFRVRFVYATWTTLFVAVSICVIAFWKAPEHFKEYSAYVAVILCLGMMISYEEENLRRTFFVLKSIRTLEFEEWFRVVLRIQGWVKERFQRRLKALRDKREGALRKDPSFRAPKTKNKIILVDTSAQMAMASRLGMYSQIFNIGIAVVDVISTALAS